VSSGRESGGEEAHIVVAAGSLAGPGAPNSDHPPPPPPQPTDVAGSFSTPLQSSRIFHSGRGVCLADSKAGRKIPATKTPTDASTFMDLEPAVAVESVGQAPARALVCAPGERLGHGVHNHS